MMSDPVVLQLLVFYGGLSIFVFGALGYALHFYRRGRGSGGRITAAEFEAANQRATDVKAIFPSIDSARYDSQDGRVVISLETGLQLAFHPRDVRGLERSMPGDLEDIVITPSRLGLRFPRIDADIYVPALVDKRHR
jgi:hypothetical protein